MQIKGGIAITMRNINDVCGPIRTFTAYKELNEILRKVISNTNFISIESIVASQGIYRFTKILLETHPEITQVSGKGTQAKIISRIVEELPNIFLDAPEPTSAYVRLISKAKKGRIAKFIKRENLQPNDYMDTYNVSLPESNGNGAFDLFSAPFITPPHTGVTDTFISIGKFDNEAEALNLLKYIKTRFIRAMLGVKKVTQHNPKETWEYVPLQDFTEHSDIDWSKSLAEIDQQLYKKYELSPEEIAFIEKMIKPMK